MIDKYHGGIVHKTVVESETDEKFRSLAAETLQNYRAAMDKYA